MELDAERDGEGVGMCAGKTTHKDGLSTQLDEVTETTKWEYCFGFQTRLTQFVRVRNSDFSL